MTFNRKEDAGNRMSGPFLKISPFFGNKSNLKMEIFYFSLVCLLANFLSSIALEIGTRLPLGQTASIIKSSAFSNLFHRNYNLKVKLLVSNLISGGFSTTLLVLGKRYNVPYLYFPWLINTMRGMALCEGPTLLRLAYILLPESDVPARSFIFITFMLYVEELCLWNKVFSSFRHSWLEYNQKKRFAIVKDIENVDFEKRNTKKSISDVGKFYGNYEEIKPTTSAELAFLKNRHPTHSRFSRNYFTNSTG